MGKHDSSIRWLSVQIEHLFERVMDIRGGHKTEINDEDVSEAQKTSNLQKIARYIRLIGVTSATMTKPPTS
jgi:hypothetical protein